jgi:hypothetical protein
MFAFGVVSCRWRDRSRRGARKKHDFRSIIDAKGVLVVPPVARLAS